MVFASKFLPPFLSLSFPFFSSILYFLFLGIWKPLTYSRNSFFMKFLNKPCEPRSRFHNGMGLESTSKDGSCHLIPSQAFGRYMTLLNRIIAKLPNNKGTLQQVHRATASFLNSVLLLSLFPVNRACLNY